LKIKDVIKLANEIDKTILKDEDKVKILMIKIQEHIDAEDIEKIIDDAIIEIQIMEELS
jgi:hypothetical protein